MQWLKERQRWDEANKIDTELKELFGNNWEKQAKNPATAYTADMQKPVSVN